MRGVRRSPKRPMISSASARMAASSAFTAVGRTRASTSSANGSSRDSGPGQAGRTLRKRTWAPTSTLSSTLKLANTRPCWKVRARPSAASLSAESSVTFWPAKVTVPASASSRSVTRLNSVVLPAPLGPMMLTSSPSFTSRSTVFTAVRPPKRRVSPRISRSALIPCRTIPAAGSGPAATGRRRRSGRDTRRRHGTPRAGRSTGPSPPPRR